MRFIALVIVGDRLPTPIQERKSLTGKIHKAASEALRDSSNLRNEILRLERGSGLLSVFPGWRGTRFIALVVVGDQLPAPIQRKKITHQENTSPGGKKLLHVL
jgi:ribosomal protein S5